MVPHMQLTLLTFLAGFFLQCVSASGITTFAASDPCIHYSPRVTPFRLTCDLCREYPLFCRNIWWRELNSDAYTTMGPDANLTFSFTGATRIQVLGSCDPFYCFASLNGVILPVNSFGGGTLFMADNLDAGTSHTLVLAHAPLLLLAEPDGALSVSAIVLDSPVPPTSSDGPRTTALQQEVSFETSTGPVLVSSSSHGGMSESTRLSISTTTTEHPTVALVTPNLSAASGDPLGEPPSGSFSQEAASGPAPTSGEITAPDSNSTKKEQQKRTFIIVLCAVVWANVLLAAAFGVWRWRRRRAIACEARRISAYTPHWHLPMQEPENDGAENHGRRLALPAQTKRAAKEGIAFAQPASVYSTSTGTRASSAGKYGYI